MAVATMHYNIELALLRHFDQIPYDYLERVAIGIE